MNLDEYVIKAQPPALYSYLCSLKVPKCEIFDPFFFTSVNPIWEGDLRTGEKKIFVRRQRQIFAILVFLRMLSLRKKIAYAC